MDDVDRTLVEGAVGTDLAAVERKWTADVTDVITRATLIVPKSGHMQRGGHVGRHTEHLGHLLAEMQILPRTYPGATW